MIDWSTVAPAIRSLVSSIATSAAKDPAFLGRWMDRQAEYIHPDVAKELILRVSRVSDFDAYRSYNTVTVPATGDTPEHQELYEVISGMKEFGLEIRVESHDHSESENRWSWSMAERIRTNLHFSRVTSAILAVGVGIVRIGDIVDVSYRFDKRRVNSALFEVTLNAAFSLTDPVTTDWFEHVALTSNFKDVTGATLSAPPNITDLVVPPLSEEDEEEEEP
ncbi:MAG TPA: hypothetical protein VM493_07810 [Vicinamibacterales bacterium]|nr:hypothetical protein [Vicinamibacterales bacterium]